MSKNKSLQNLRPFKPGQSGNPGGRAKIPASVVEASRALTKKAIKTLEEIMLDTSTPPSIRVNAAQALLDRGWGKPAQHLDVSTDQPGTNIYFDYSNLSEGEMVCLLALIGKTQRQAVQDVACEKGEE